MSITNIFVWIIIGLIAGYLAGKFVKGKGFGALGNIVIGLVGSVIGGFLFSIIGLGSENIIGTIVVSTVGAIVLLVLAKALKS